MGVPARSLFYGDGLREVTWLIHVAAAAYGDVISEKLQRNDFKNRREQLRRRRNFNRVIRGAARKPVAFRHYSNNDSISSLHLLQIRNGLLVAGHGSSIRFVACSDDDNGQILVDERVRAVLHLSSGVAFGMDVRNFLQLESAFQRDRIVNTTPEVKEIAMTKKLLRQFFNVRVTLKNGFDLVRDSR